MKASKTPRLNEDVWRIIITHLAWRDPENEYLTACERYDDRRLVDERHEYDPTSRFHSKRKVKVYSALLNLSLVNRELHDWVSDELYKHIHPCHQVGFKNIPLLLRTLAESPKIRSRVKHITLLYTCQHWGKHLKHWGEDLSPYSTIKWMMLRPKESDFQQAREFLDPMNIGKMDPFARAVLRTAGLELIVPSNVLSIYGPVALDQSTWDLQLPSIGWQERACAALVCLSTGLRSLSVQDPLPPSHFKLPWGGWDMNAFESIIRRVRNHPIADFGKSVFQMLEAVSLSTSKHPTVSQEAFSVYSSPRLTEFQAVGFLDMKDW